MTAQDLLKLMKKFLDGVISAYDFSFEFEQALYSAKSLKQENHRLYLLLNDELPELCANFEPDPELRKQFPDDYFDEETVRGRVSEIYKEAVRLTEGA